MSKKTDQGSVQSQKEPVFHIISVRKGEPTQVMTEDMPERIEVVEASFDDRQFSS